MTNDSLATQLRQIGLRALPPQLDDFIAHATKARWSPHQFLEELVKAEATERSRRSPERRLRLSGIYKEAVPLQLVESALLLGTLRRRARASELPPLPGIRSLAYFLPVIGEH
jgi:hypothetical protein